MGQVGSRQSEVGSQESAAAATLCTLQSTSVRCSRLVLPTHDSRLTTPVSRLVQPEIPELHAALELGVPAADRLGAEGDVAGITDLDRRDFGVVRLLNLFEDGHAGFELRLGKQLRG